MSCNSLHPLSPLAYFSDTVWGNRLNDVSAAPTFRMFLPCHEGEDGFSVVVGLLFTRCARVLAIVGQFIHPAQVADGVAEEEEKMDGQVLCPDSSW